MYQSVPDFRARGRAGLGVVLRGLRRGAGDELSSVALGGGGARLADHGERDAHGAGGAERLGGVRPDAAGEGRGGKKKRACLCPRYLCHLRWRRGLGGVPTWADAAMLACE